MLDNKYNKVLTIILVIVAVAILIILGFWGYDIIRKRNIDKDTNQALTEFENVISKNKNKKKNNNNDTDNEIGNVELDQNLIVNQSASSTSSKSKLATQTYKGFTVSGKIEIPAIKLAYPVLDRATKSSIKVAVGISYGVGLNNVGNTVIMGHNFRDGTFFSNLKNLKNGDVIYITDLTGTKIKYTIYNMYTTSASDFDYAVRDTAGKREISLSTCTDDVQARLVIWAKED